MPEASRLRSTVAPSSPGPTTLFQLVTLGAILFGVITSAAMLGGAWGRK